MSEKQKITKDNLMPYLGQNVSLYCSVGVVFSVEGILKRDCNFCHYGVDTGYKGQTIGFSFGEFQVREGKLHISVS